MTPTPNRLFAAVAIGAVALLSACGGEAASDESAGSSGSSGEASGVAAGCADGASGELRLAINQTEEHPSTTTLEAFGERLSEATDGRWSVDVYPNETLGAQAETLALVGDGTVDMAVVSGPQLENLNEDFIVFNLPGVFDDVDHQMSVVNNPELVSDLYSSLEESNDITVVGGFTQGARSVYTKDNPVETPADLAGLNLRVQESDVNIAMAEALGASATPLAFGELYTALQSGVVDAAENNEVSYYTQNHYEVAPYFSYTNHLVGLDYIIINSGVLASMCDEDRAAFDAEWQVAYADHTELWEEQSAQAVADAEAGGATFSEVDTEAFQEALEPLVDQFVTTDSQQQLYDAARDAA